MPVITQLFLVLISIFFRNEALAAVQPKVCGEEYTTTVTFYSECTSCFGSFGCPQGSTPGPVRVCTYKTTSNSPPGFVSRKGCQMVCNKTETVRTKQCCAGYWGPNCDECPGGVSTLCSHHGNCSDLLTGDGRCQCDSGFNGTACEECIDGYYGQNCKDKCSCLNGTCRSGISGNGSCDCFSGFTGRFCNETIMDCASGNVTCHANARCIVGKDGAKCVCKPHFRGNGTHCEMIDWCTTKLVKSFCHENAKCKSIRARLFICTCNDGYRGDGKYCQPIDPCQKDNGGCPTNSTECVYTSPGQHECRCLPHFENYTEGRGCTVADMCLSNSSICHRKASCSTPYPGQIQCTCNAGYIGDGKYGCYGNIIQSIVDLCEENATMNAKLNNSLRFIKRFADKINFHGPLTVFLPTDNALKRRLLKKNDFQKLFTNVEWGWQIVKQHMIAGQFSSKSLKKSKALYTMQGVAIQLSIKNYSVGEILSFKLQGSASRGRMVREDIISSNGIVHIIDTVFDRPPVVKGSVKKTALDVVRADGRYNRFESLLWIGGMNKVLKEKQVTIFAPSNAVWDKMLPGTFKYLKSEKGRGKLIGLMKNHIIIGNKTSCMDLLEMKEFISAANIGNKVMVMPNGQIRLNDKVNIKQTDIPSTNGLIHHVDGILLPDTLQPIVPQRCDKEIAYATTTSMHHCISSLGQCRDPMAYYEWPVFKTHIFGGVQRSIWSYLHRLQCHCQMKRIEKECCTGFYGSECYSCPGGFFNPCKGNGKCMDGIRRNGTCQCHKQYTGAVCELCSDPYKYGAACNLTCKCVHGVCDNRVEGSRGHCLRGSCADGFSGPDCDQTACVIQSLGITVTCHIHGVCNDKISRSAVFGRSYRVLTETMRRMYTNLVMKTRCVTCKPGYAGNGKKCEEINPCFGLRENQRLCHPQAVCKHTGPDQSTCECRTGWVGDGTYCYPSSTCQDHSECHQNASCVITSPGQYFCTCNAGFHGNGSYCVLEDPCTITNGGCHPNATCEDAGPGEVVCTCPAELAGDGYFCFGDLAREITLIPQLSVLSTLIKSVPMDRDYLSDVQSNLTLFAPSNNPLKTFMNTTNFRYWQKEEHIMTLMGYHTIDSLLSAEDLKLLPLPRSVKTLEGSTLEISLQNKTLYINSAKVITWNIPALNGYIHVIDRVLEPYPVTNDGPLPEEFFSNHSDFSLFAGYLKKYNLLDGLGEISDSYTIFAPKNEDFPVDDPRTKDKRFFKSFIAPNRLPINAIKDGQMEDTVLGFGNNLKFTVKNKQVFVNGIRVISSNFWTAGGVVHAIGGVFSPVLNRCDQYNIKTQEGPCLESCNMESPKCPADYEPYVPELLNTKCILSAGTSGQVIRYGCSRICRRRTKEPACCSGYYGRHCHACPGGVGDVCSAHGQCLDGVAGSGECLCDQHFTGPACESCVASKSGTLCNNTADLCSTDNGGCSSFAECTNVHGRSVTCKCRTGFIGNGTVCKKPCDIKNGGCPPKARCVSEPLATNVSCICPTGFEGLRCHNVTDLCLTQSDRCSPNAVCKTVLSSNNDTENVHITCTCVTGYIGNGSFCEPIGLSHGGLKKHPKSQKDLPQQNLTQTVIIACVGFLGAVLIAVAAVCVYKKKRQANYYNDDHKVCANCFPSSSKCSADSDKVKFCTTDQSLDTEFSNPMFST